ncbi:GRIP and coiled-coil domain-containing protein-like [Onthophagus taurus]|uniref:GRIP and coiled-coil domain-containing protein-like n=1 Tax=Onthophagus taurus TaxID=166361 RepID=UPI0039BE5EE8
MAWLQDLAIKTETLLDKIDKGANNLFNETNDPDSEVCLSIQIPEDNYMIQENQFIDLSNSNSSNELINESETNIEWYKTEIDMIKSNYECKNIELEDYNNRLRRQLLDLQHNFSEVNNENEFLKSQVEQARNCVLTVENEMIDYKNKVQKVLCNKEFNFVKEIPDKIKINEDLQKNIEYLEEVNRVLSLKIQTLTQNLNCLHDEYKNSQYTNSKDLKNLQNNLENERKLRISLDKENQDKNAEITALTLELNNQVKLFEEKRKECDTLRDGMNKSEEKIDLTLRVQSLTETLISKQNTLETLSTEKTVLKLQLEKIRNEFLQMIDEKDKELKKRIQPIKKFNEKKSFYRSKLFPNILIIYIFLVHFMLFIILYYYIPK